MKIGADRCFNILTTYSSVWVVGCVKVFLGYVTVRCINISGKHIPLLPCKGR